jgi:hypothetical protein
VRYSQTKPRAAGKWQQRGIQLSKIALHYSVLRGQKQLVDMTFFGQDFTTIADD